MATKQLEILVMAQDHATRVFRDIGDSAEGAGARLEGLAEAGHGIHSILRQARNIGIAFELVPPVIDGVKAAFATLHGTVEEAASAQRGFFNALKEIPLVGKFVAPAFEAISNGWAHLIGHESTSELEAEVAKKKEILEQFAETAKKFKSDLAKEDEEAATAGLFPSDQQIEKAKAKYAAKQAEIHDFKRKLILAAGEGEDVREATAEVERMQEDADRIRLNEIREAHAKEIEEDQAFAAKLVAQEKSRFDAIESLQADFDRQQLEEQGRGLEAKIAGIQAAADKQVAALRAGLEKESEEKQKEIEALQPIAQSGGPDAAKAQQRQHELMESKADAYGLEGEQERIVKAKAADEAAAARNEELKRTQHDLLQQQADAGDKNVAEQLKEQAIADDLNAKRSALLAILKDGTAEQKAAAQAELQDLDVQQKKLAAIKAQNEENKQAAAEKKEDDETDRKIQEAMKREDEKNQHAEAREAKKDSAVGPADVEASQYLTGVTAKAEQQRSDPTTDAVKEASNWIQKLYEVCVQGQAAQERDHRRRQITITERAGGGEMAEATERFSQDLGIREISGNWTATRAWDVVNFTSGDPVDEAMNATGVLIGSPYPFTTSLVCTHLGVTENKLTKMVVVANYGISQIVANDPNPLLRPPMVSFRWGKESKQVDTDVNGNPILNSALDAFKNSHSKNFSVRYLTITRYESDYNEDQAAGYVDTCNSDSVILQGITRNPGQVYCLGIAPASEYQVGAPYVRVSYAFAVASPNTSGLTTQQIRYPWQFRVLDQGLRAQYQDPNNSNTKTLGNFWLGGSNAAQCTRDVLLNGHGVPIDPTILVTQSGYTPITQTLPSGVIVDTTSASATFLVYMDYAEQPFTPLGLE